MTDQNPPLILASSSPYRKQLLQRLQLPFECLSPDIDESSQAGESAVALVKRLAWEKCRTIAEAHPHHIVIGSDQLLAINGQILSKPGTKPLAQQQLQQLSGQQVIFHTALCVYQPTDQQYQNEIVDTEVQFRHLDQNTIDRYLEREDALDCAGSFKSEALGISLTEAIHTTDPTALIGLPLITLCQLLREAGVSLP